MCDRDTWSWWWMGADVSHKDNAIWVVVCHLVDSITACAVGLMASIIVHPDGEERRVGLYIYSSAQQLLRQPVYSIRPVAGSV